MADEFSPAFSAAYDAPVLVGDEISVSCGLVADLSACWGPEGNTTYESLTTRQKEIVGALAASTLNLLTARMVANCPIQLRPCSPRCCVPGYSAYGAPWTPVMTGVGLWVNACGCPSTCACTRSKALDLVGPVAEVMEVRIDGVALDPEAYRLEGGRWLFRNDGEQWPTQQNLNLPTTEADTFAVVVRPGYALGTYGQAALGRLVCEYSKAMCGKKCGLPKGVTSITRAGVTMDITPGLFADGLTGIREVDVFIEAMNPHHMITLPTITSPDMRR